MIHIAFHRADLDGIGSCMVVLKSLLEQNFQAKDITLHAWNYGEPAPEVENGDIIYIVDCSFKPEEMQALGLGEQNGLIKVCWIDHHKTAYDDSVRHGYDLMGGVRSLNRPSAVELCWKHFFGSSNIPFGIVWLSQYDTWCNEDAWRWDNEIMPFQMGMRLAPWLKDLMGRKDNTDSLRSLVDRFHNFCHADTETPMDNGRIILDYQQTQNEITSKRAFSFRFEGITFACINGFGNSQTFTGIPFLYEACMLFYYDGVKNIWRFSLYGVNDKGETCPFDLSIIAKSRGGGGHAKACGFEVAQLGSVFGHDEGPALNTNVETRGPRPNY